MERHERMDGVSVTVRRVPTPEQLRVVAGALCELAIGRTLDEVSDWAYERYIDDARLLLSNAPVGRAGERDKPLASTWLVIDGVKQACTEEGCGCKLFTEIGNQRYRCNACGSAYRTEPEGQP